MMEIKPYQTGDEKQILELFNISFGKPLSEVYWKWRFADHPEKKMMIMLMWDGEQLVGHYAVSPVRMFVEKEEVLTALSMTTMTHPDYAGRGIFKELAEALYSTEKSANNLAAVWGYPNNNSHYGFLKNVQWKNLEQVPTFSIDTKLIEETENQIQVGSGFGPRHAVGDSNANFKVQIKRDAAYLNWRYATNPVNEYVLFESEHEGEIHFVVAKKFGSFQEAGKFEADILEWELPADLKIQQQFLSAIKNHFGASQLARVNMWIPLNDPRHIQLEKIGFRNLAPITYSGIRLLNPEFGSMLNVGNWHYNMGYSDIY
jgi:predicted N-acetyltransferase YhbS